MFGKSDASTSTTDDVKVRPLWVYYFPQALGVLSAEPPSAVPAGGDMWAPRARRPGALLRPAASPATTLLTDEPWLSSSSSEPRRLLPYARFLPPLRLPTPRSFSPDSDDLWALPARPTKLSLPPIDIPQIEAIERDNDSPCSPTVTTVTAWSCRSVRRVRRTRGVRKRRTRLADLQRVVAALPRRILHGGAIPSRCSAALRAALRELRAAWTPVTTPHTYLISRNWSLSEQKETCEQDSHRSSSGMSRRALWAELGARPGASPGLLRRRYSAPETIMRKYRLEQQREACCSSATSCRSAASSPAAPRAPLARRALLRAALHHPPPPPLAHPPPAHPPPALDALEVVVTETLHIAPPPYDRYPPPSLPADIDEYVSSVLVESLNSLTDRIESVISSESRLSIVEKEIKVRLQSTGVNTIVHLSPTSNNQIIFGNEELYDRDDDGNERDKALDPPPSEPDEREHAASGVLRQLRRLFHEDARLEVSSVDAFLRSSGGAPASISVVAAPSPPASLADSLDDPASPRRAAPPPPPRPLTPRAPPEAFFVGMGDEAPASAGSVAAVLPARLRQRLQRRQRRRQQRAASRRRRPAARDAAALLDALLDDLLAAALQDDYRALQEERRRRPLPSVPERDTLERRLDAEQRARRLRGRLSLQPHPPIASTNSRRLYQKSEITDGGKRVEILEIVEFAESSSSSAETSAAEEAQRRRSRIPVPVAASGAARLRRLLAALEPPRAAAGAPGQRRSAATSPPPRAAHSRATMTSPARRHAATSPRRPAPTPPPSPPPSPPPALPPPALQEKRPETPERPPKAPIASKPSEPSKTTKSGTGVGAEDSSSSCEERGLLCALPRRRRAPRRRAAPTPRVAPAPAPTPAPPPKSLPKTSIPSIPSPGPKRELELAIINLTSTEPATTISTETAVARTLNATGAAVTTGNGTDTAVPTRTATDTAVTTGNATNTAVTTGNATVTGVVTGNAGGAGWSVTVAGERMPPHELQLRLRFPPAQPACQESSVLLPQPSSTPDTSRTSVACACRHCRPGGRALPPAHPAHPPHPPTRGSSKAYEARLPSLRRDSIVSQSKTRRTRSPRWLAAHHVRTDSCLQVVGAAVVPLPRAVRRHR